MVNKPGHTKGVEFLVKEFHSLRKYEHSVIRALSYMSCLINALSAQF